MEEKCMYFHVDSQTEEIVYVGIGESSRAFNTTGRKSDHREWLNKNEHEVLIVSEGLTPKEARELEKDHIKYLRPRFNIKHNPDRYLEEYQKRQERLDSFCPVEYMKAAMILKGHRE